MTAVLVDQYYGQIAASKNAARAEAGNYGQWGFV